MRTQAFCVGAGSVAAVLGLIFSGTVTGLATDHMLDTMIQVNFGAPGWNTLAKSFLAFYAGLLGVVLHRSSTFTLRYSMGHESRSNPLRWMVGRNEDKPSWTGFPEELRKIKLTFKATIGGVRNDLLVHPVNRPPRSVRADPWLWLGGRTTLGVQVLTYLASVTLGFFALYLNGMDWIASALLGFSAATYTRGLASLAILSINGNIGAGIILYRAIRRFWDVWVGRQRGWNAWQVCRELMRAFGAASLVLKNEKARNIVEWHRTTTRVLYVQ